MTLYVDSSAFTRRYSSDEPDHEECVELMDSDEAWITSRLTVLETVRALHLSRTPVDVATAVAQFDDELSSTPLIDVTREVLAVARGVSLETGMKSLDAIHIASMKLVEDDSIQLLTFDRQQTRGAARLGLRLAR